MGRRNKEKVVDKDEVSRERQLKLIEGFLLKSLKLSASDHKQRKVEVCEIFAHVYSKVLEFGSRK